MPDTVNVILTLFIATFVVTGVLWLALAVSGQASLNVNTGGVTPSDTDPDLEMPID